MRAQQNALGIALDIQRLEIAALGCGAHHTLGGLNAKHRVRCNLAGNFQRPYLDLVGRHAFFDNAQVPGGAPVDFTAREHKHPGNARTGALVKQPA